MKKGGRYGYIEEKYKREQGRRIIVGFLSNAEAKGH